MLILKVVLLFSLVPFAIFVVYRLVVGFRSAHRQAATRQHFEDGLKKSRDGNMPESLTFFLKAESAWALNSHDGSPESLLKDLEQYTKIANAIAKPLNLQSVPVCQDIRGLVGEMRELLGNRGNFGVDGRKMKPDVITRWKRMRSRLKVLRSKLRQECAPRLPKRRH